MTTAVKKQHYVSRFYLKNWLSKSNGKIKVYNKKNNKEYFCTDLNSISQERFFYELHITQNVFDLILSRYYTKALNNPFLKEFIELSNLLLRLNEYQNDKNYNYEKTKVINKNVLEKEYSKIENVISNVINQINNDLNTYLHELKKNPKKSLALIELFNIQFYRTKQMREKLNDIIKKLFVKKDNIEKKLSDDETIAFFKIMQYLDPLIESQKIIENGFSIELIKNNTENNFITSNSPAIIDKVDGKYMGFMPITPSIFLIVQFQTTAKKFNYREINDAITVNALNSKIYENSNEIYTIK